MSCGSGIRKRQVSCVNEVTGSVLANEECSSREGRPVAAEACDGGPCGKWHHGEWGPCSVTCGAGQTTRQVRCLAVDTSMETLEDDQCDNALRPPTQQPCQTYCKSPGSGTMADSAIMHHPSGNFVEGPYRWRYGQWNSCSKSCGGGTQRRQVVCVDNLDSKSRACNPQLRPPETQRCNTEECPKWVTSDWTKCDQDCGRGTQTRQVACKDSEGLPLSDAHCPQPSPERRQPCNVHSCSKPLATWHSGPWSSVLFRFLARRFGGHLRHWV